MDTDDLMKKAQEMMSNLSDEQIDDVAQKAKDMAPESVDDKVDMAADFLKGHNDK